VSQRVLVSAVAVAPRQSSDAADSRRLRIGAFNIQVFGVSKLKRDGVLPVLVNVSFNILHTEFLAINFEIIFTVVLETVDLAI
jgi:hypothetical protein